MNGITNKIVMMIVERIPFVSKALKFLDGHKTTVGRVGVFLASIFWVAMHIWPEVAIISQASVLYSAFAFWLFEQLGIEHKKIKGHIKFEKQDNGSEE